jgi:hypothetical protein
MNPSSLKLPSSLWRASPDRHVSALACFAAQASRVSRSLKAVGVDGFDGFKETYIFKDVPTPNWLNLLDWLKEFEK